MRRLIPILALAAMPLTAVPAAASAATDPLELVASQALDARLTQLTFTTPALSGQVHVRVLLPAGYASSKRRYPVLYLLHGSSGSAAQWTTDGFSAETLTASLPLIVVMPDGGANGEYTNWVDPPAAQGPQQWETFHIDQLVPWIDAHYRTLAARADRAISGESMGGLGTMEYAARYPDLFGVAASLSGAAALLSPDGLAGVLANESVFGTVPPYAIYGSPATDELNYRDHNPPDLAMNLGNTQLWLSSYDGIPNSGDQYGGEGAGNVLELGVHEDSEEVVAALRTLGIPVAWHDLGDGVHATPEFDHQLSLALPWIMTAFAHPKRAPASVAYASAAPNWTMWGWTVAVTRPAAEFSVLREASSKGFELYGSGSAVVTTPAVYEPGARYRVTLTPSLQGEPGAAKPELGCDQTGATDNPTIEVGLCEPAAPAPPYATITPLNDGTGSTVRLTADRAGRLVVPVALGPGNAHQEYVAETNLASRIFRTTVSVSTLDP